MASSDFTELMQTDEKKDARLWNVKLFRELTGHQSVPSGREYWTLSALQSNDASSEINQMVSLQLITKSQYHGVDRDANVVATNKMTHPSAKFYAGEWIVIVEREMWNPGMVYLDTVSVIDTEELADMVIRTLRQCPQECLVVVNALLRNSYTGYIADPQVLIDKLVDRMTEREANVWGLDSGIEAMTYSSGKTPMVSLALYRAKAKS